MKAILLNNPYVSDKLKENQCITLYYRNIFFNYYMN